MFKLQARLSHQTLKQLNEWPKFPNFVSQRLATHQFSGYASKRNFSFAKVPHQNFEIFPISCGFARKKHLKFGGGMFEIIQCVFVGFVFN